MKLSISADSARWLCVTAATARVFFGIAIDTPELYSATWLAALMGGVLVLPIGFAANAWTKKHSGMPYATLSTACGKGAVRALSFLWILVMTVDAASIAMGITYSAGYVALRSNSVLYLRTGLMLVILYSVSMNGIGLGSSSRIWIKAFPLLMGVVILLQFSSYRFGFLAPILGKNAATLLQGAFRSAGWYASLFPIWIIAKPGRVHRQVNMVWSLGMSCGLATVLLLLLSMESPAMQGAIHTRVFQFDLLFANGRFPLALQLPLIILWFISLLYLLCSETFASAALLQAFLPKIHGRILILVIVIGIFAVSLTRFSEREITTFLSIWQYIAVWASFLSLFLAAQIRKAGKSQCENAV